MADEPNYVLIDRRVLEPFAHAFEMNSTDGPCLSEADVRAMHNAVNIQDFRALSTALAVATPAREALARIILGPNSHWNTHFPSVPGKSLEDWRQYREVTRAFAKADSILTLLGGERGEETGSPQPQETRG